MFSVEFRVVHTKWDMVDVGTLIPNLILLKPINLCDLDRGNDPAHLSLCWISSM